MTKETFKSALLLKYQKKLKSIHFVLKKLLKKKIMKCFANINKFPSKKIDWALKKVKAMENGY